MAKRSRRFMAIKDKLGQRVVGGLSDVVREVKTFATAKFDETIDLAINLGVDPRHADQMIRGTVTLPHGSGKTVRVLAFAKGEKASEAEEAGADYVGAEDLAEKISGGWLEFDRVVACPDVMGIVGRLGRVLGPRGLMPNPKLGTVTFDMAQIVREIKSGQVAFRVEKNGIVHVGVGKASFSVEHLEENIKMLIEQLRKMRPATTKGTYLKKMTLSSTMGPGIVVDPHTV